MTNTDFYSLIRSTPFVPLRIFVSDGSRYEVKHPELVTLTYSTVRVTVIKPAANSEFVDEVCIISLSHIVRIEFNED